MFWVFLIYVGLRTEPLFLTVEGSLLDIDLLEILDVFAHSQGLFAHIIAVYFIEWSIVGMSQKGRSVFNSRVEAIWYHSHSPLFSLLSLDFVLPGSWDYACWTGLFPSICMSKVANFGGATFFKRVELIGWALDIQKTLFTNLLLILVAESLYSFYLDFVFSKYFVSVFSELLLVVIMLIYICKLVIAWPRQSLLIFSRLVYSWTELILAVVKRFAGNFVRVVVTRPREAILQFLLLNNFYLEWHASAVHYLINMRP